MPAIHASQATQQPAGHHSTTIPCSPIVAQATLLVCIGLVPVQLKTRRLYARENANYANCARAVYVESSSSEKMAKAKIKRRKIKIRNGQHFVKGSFCKYSDIPFPTCDSNLKSERQKSYAAKGLMGNFISCIFFGCCTFGL